MKIAELHPNTGQIEGVPSNPRTISNENFEALKKSVKNFFRMMAIRPIVVDENYNILGGNMRYKALLKLAEEAVTINGYTFGEEIPDEWVRIAKDLTPAEKKAFIMKDNEERGQWDYDKLAHEWEQDKLKEWDAPTAFEETETEIPNACKAQERIIIMYKPEQKTELAKLLGIDSIERQRYSCEEIINLRND